MEEAVTVLRSHDLCVFDGCAVERAPGRVYCKKHDAGRAGQATNTVFEQFCEGTLKLLDDKAKEKNYAAAGIAGANILWDFTNATFPDHALGEIVYKAVRFKSKRDPEDLLKIAAWAFLEWRSAVKR